jgi:hypothetical protein
MLKYLIVATVLVLFLVLVYSKLHPYFKTLGKIVGTIRTIAKAGKTGNTTGSSTGRVEGKLVRCVTCGTWVPMERGIGRKANLAATYCSTQCLEKASETARRKAAS